MIHHLIVFYSPHVAHWVITPSSRMIPDAGKGAIVLFMGVTNGVFHGLRVHACQKTLVSGQLNLVQHTGLGMNLCEELVRG